MEACEFLPENNLPVYLSIKKAEDLVSLGKENLEVMLKKWREQIEGMDGVIRLIESYSKLDSKQTIKLSFCLPDSNELNMVLIDSDSNTAERLLSPLKSYHLEKKKSAEEKSALLGEMVQKANSKPLLPFFRIVDYVLDQEDIMALKKKTLTGPRWMKTNPGMLIVGGNPLCGMTCYFQVGNEMLPHWDPRLLSASDLRFLRKNRDYAELWVESTKNLINHKDRHAILYSFK